MNDIKLEEQSSVNAVTEFFHLSDHIDEPIKKCVVGLNLLGIKTAMSCCGFSYLGEKVPKKHLRKAYVYIKYEELGTKELRHLFELAKLSGWNMKFMNPKIIDFFGHTWEQQHPWNDKDCPHFYEVFALSINALERSIDSLSSAFLDGTYIDDGNKMYVDDFKIKNWQYRPTQSWWVTPETYRNL